MTIATLPEAVRRKLWRLHYTWRIHDIYTHIYAYILTWENTTHQFHHQFKKNVHIYQWLHRKAIKKRWCLRAKNSKSVTLGLFYSLHQLKYHLHMLCETAHLLTVFSQLLLIFDENWWYSVADKNKTHYICFRKRHWKAADRSSLPGAATAQLLITTQQREVTTHTDLQQSESCKSTVILCRKN